MSEDGITMSSEQRTATPGVHQIRVGLDGFPDVPNQHGSGDLRSDYVDLFYFPNGVVAARLYGCWVPGDDAEADGRLRNNYKAASKGETEDWPDWLAELAREHVPFRLADTERAMPASVVRPHAEVGAALVIDWAAHATLTPREQYDAAGDIIDEAKAAAAARRSRIAHDLARQHGAKEAARILGISATRVYALVDRYRESQPVIADNFPGRSIARYDLLGEVEERYGMGAREAHEAIHALLQNLIEVDGEDQVVIARTPQRPALLKSNPGDVDVRYWLTVRAESVDEIREALATQYADE